MSDTAAPAVSQEAKPKQAKKNHLSGGIFPFRPDSIPAHYSNRFHSRHRRVFRDASYRRSYFCGIGWSSYP